MTEPVFDVVLEWAGEGSPLGGKIVGGNGEDINLWRQSDGASDPIKVGDKVTQFTVVSSSNTGIWPGVLVTGFEVELQPGTYSTVNKWLNSVTSPKPLQEYQELYDSVSSITDAVPTTNIALSQIFELKEDSTSIGYTWLLMLDTGEAWELDGLVSGTTLPFIKNLGKEYSYNPINMGTVTTKPTIQETFDAYLQSQGTYPNTYYFKGGWQFVATIT